MKRMLRAAAAAAILTSGLGSIGCVSTGTCGKGGCGGGDGHGGVFGDLYRKTNDPCYPERYQYAAREAVVAPFAQQVHNGYVLNQTIYNHYFEFGTSTLTPAGAEKLISLARARPGPDARIYLQTARDLPANADPAKVADVRATLDVKRAEAIQKFMANQPAFAGPVAYEIFVHDPATPGIHSDMAGNAYRGSIAGYRGGVSGAGTGVLGTGGSANLTTAPAGSGTTGARP